MREFNEDENTEALIAESLKLFWIRGSVYELRAPNTKKHTLSGYYDSLAKCASDAARLTDEAPGVYITLSPVDPDLLHRAPNKFVAWAKHTTADQDIPRRRQILIDFDPVRKAGISANDEQHELAIKRASRAGRYLKDLGWSYIRIDSGNGAHLLVPVDLPNDKPTTDAVQKLLQGLAFKYDDERVTVDQKTYNAARITKVPGTWARKGGNAAQRPHRQSKFLKHVLGTPNVSIDMIRDVIADLLPTQASGSPEKSIESGRLQSMLEGAGVKIIREKELEDGTLYEFDCPFFESHTGKAFAIEFSNRKIAAGCQADKCSEKKWSEFKEKLGISGSHEASETSELHADGNGSKPTLDLNDDFSDVVTKAARGLEGSNDPPWLFRYGDSLAEVRPSSGVKIKVHSISTLREPVAKCMRIVRSAGKGRETPQPPPGDLLSSLLETGQLQLPELLQVSQVPVVAPDGSISTQAGYHPASKTYLATKEFEGLDVSRVSEEEVWEAVRWFKLRPLHDFPFDCYASLAHFFCLMLLPFVRPLISGPTPLHVIEAPTRATGKSLLARFAIGISSDHCYDGGLNNSESELEKTLASILRAGYTHVLFDNATGRIESASIDKVLSSLVHVVRILGGLNTGCFPNNATWILTANNAEIVGDTPSRCVSIRLDAQLEAPEKRADFAIRSLLKWARNNRVKIVGKLLIILRYWIQEGMPRYEGDKAHRMGEWASVMGGICQCSGIDGFLENMDAFEQRADSDYGNTAKFFEDWFSRLGNKPVHTSELVQIAYGGTEDEDHPGPLYTEKIGYCKNTKSMTTILGKWLKGHVGQVYCGKKLVVIADTRQERTYALREVK